MSYYKTNDPAVLAAVEDYRNQVEALQSAGKGFAKKFGGAAVFARGITNSKFSGVRFSPRKDSPIWTKPDRDNGTQRPRAKAATGATAEQKAELVQLNAEWNAGFPNIRAEHDTLYSALGTNWGELLFGGIGYFEGKDGYFYVETGAKLGDHMEEIKGSEYMTAKEALNEAEEQAA